MSDAERVDGVLEWLVKNADRNPTMTVVFALPEGSRTYKARVWRDGTIAFRPVDR